MTGRVKISKMQDNISSLNSKVDRSPKKKELSEDLEKDISAISSEIDNLVQSIHRNVENSILLEACKTIQTALSNLKVNGEGNVKKRKQIHANIFTESRENIHTAKLKKESPVIVVNTKPLKMKILTTTFKLSIVIFFHVIFAILPLLDRKH